MAKKEEESIEEETLGQTAANIAAKAALRRAKRVSKPTYEKRPELKGDTAKVTLDIKQAKKGSWAESALNKKHTPTHFKGVPKDEVVVDRGSDYTSNGKKAPAEYIGEPNRPKVGHKTKPRIGWLDEEKLDDVTNAALNRESKEARLTEQHYKTNTRDNEYNRKTYLREPVPEYSEYDRVERARGQYKIAEGELESRGFEKSPKKRSKIGLRPHHYKKGMSTLKALGPIGALMGLAMSDDVSAAIDPTGSTSMDYNKAFEDPSSPEYAERISLLETLKVKKKDK